MVLGIHRWVVVVAFALSFAVVGCGDDDDDGDTGGTGGDEDGGNSGSGGSGGTGGKGGAGGSAGSAGSSGSGGTGGSSGTGGTGGSAGQDAGPDTSMPDPCADVADKCTTAGKTCSSESLVTCAADANGCLVATTTDCTTGDTDYCDEAAATPACASCAASDCSAASVTCDDDDLVVCATDDNGCWVQTTTDCTANPNDFCDSGATPDRCAACPATTCTEAGTSCNGTTLVTCTANADGCLVAANTQCANQTASNTCEEASDAASCVKKPCLKADGTMKDNVCVNDAPTCAENVLVTCTADADLCPIADTIDCEVEPDSSRPGNNYNYCETDGTDACAYDPCLAVTAPCLTAGKFCRDNEIIECKLDANQCLVEAPVQACGTDKVCDDPAGVAEPACVACTDAPGCAADGDKTCATPSDVLSTCKDEDNNGCLEIVTETCGAAFDCNTTTGCTYNGDDSDCDEALDADKVIRASGPTAVFNTAPEMSEYSGFVCPQFTANLPFQAAGKDILFALEVPARSVISVGLDMVAGFTGTKAWMLLLEGCADTGTTQIETQCKAASDRDLSYANEGTETKRVYVVVDADGAANQGTFRLVVETRTLDCGDGERDGSEKCDDGNIVVGDGCSPTCELESGYVCTDTDPSVCTRRPPANAPVCGNVTCPTLATGDGLLHCCTTTQKCGVAYPPLFGNVCIEREPAGTDDADCDSETNMFGAIYQVFAPNIPGCCNANNQCGLRTPAGCTERRKLWDLMQDGSARVYYEGPFTSSACN